MTGTADTTAVDSARWTQQEIGQFRERGYRLVRGLVPAERLTRLAEAVGPLLGGGQDHDGMHREYEPGGAVTQVYLAHRHHPLFRALATGQDLTGPVRQLAGDGIYIWHSKINVKQALTGVPWLWHQDYGYWRLEGVAPALVSAVVYLDYVNALNGGILLVPGSHRWGDVEHVHDTTTTVRAQRCVAPAVLIDRVGGDDILSADGAPGDVLFFDCRLVHGSGHNMSARARRLFIVAYNTLANSPPPDSSDRPDWVVARMIEPLL
jgi:ectoine hydroxylase